MSNELATRADFLPGVRTIPRAEYHCDPCPSPSLSSSIIRELLRSPRHAWCAHPRLGGIPGEDNDVRASLGTIAHSILLEGDESKIVAVDAEDWRTKAAREARDSAWAANQHPILAANLDNVRAMVEEARQFIADSGFADEWNDAPAEESLFWQDGETWCRALLDKRGKTVTFDYKTTENAKHEAWIRNQLVGMGYDVQTAWYMRGRDALHEPAGFLFLVQEITKPYACAWVGMSPAMHALAERKIEYALALWRTCLAANEWPAYSTQIAWAEPLPWQEAAAMELSVEGA